MFHSRWMNRTWTGVLVVLVGAACAANPGVQVGSEPETGAEAGAVSSDELPAGTEMTAELDTRLGIEDTGEGDSFRATVDAPVMREGVTVVPQGALIEGRVTAVHRSEGEDDPNVIKLAFERIEIEGNSYPLNAEITEATPETESGETLKKGAIGAAAGAVLAGVITEDALGTLLGAGLGAAAGTAVALGTRDEEAFLARGSKIQLRTTERLALR